MYFVKHSTSMAAVGSRIKHKNKSSAGRQNSQPAIASLRTISEDFRFIKQSPLFVVGLAPQKAAAASPVSLLGAWGLCLSAAPFCSAP